MARGHSPDIDQHEPGSSVLVVGPPMDASETVATVDAIQRAGTDGDDDRHPLVVVSRAHTAEAILEGWRDTVGTFPTDFGIVSIGEVTRSVATGTAAMTLPQASIFTVGSEDVTGIGIAIGEALTHYGEDTTPVLWFESLTPLLEEKGLEMTFRFLHVTLEEIRQANATAYVHIDSSVHDEQTITTLTHLFDDVLEYGRSD
ncbi:hypothetical protein ACLI4Y_09565 [Natrialbaceae archaeon A-CW3]